MKIALFLTAFYMFAEAIGGWFANSLALIADAGHMLTDTAALSLTLGAIWFASRPATEQKTYGYYRLEILAALINAIILIVLSIWVIYEAYLRLTESPEIKGFEMMGIAAGGLIVNLICIRLLHADHEHDLNMKGAWLHVVGDALGSLTAVIAGILIIVFGWNWADSVSSFLISVIIIFGSLRLVKDSTNVLLEGTPTHISLADVESAITQTKGVISVHDLHIWTIASGLEALSAHVLHDETIVQGELLRLLRHGLVENFGINHLTIQLETVEFVSKGEHECSTAVNCFQPKSGVS